MYCPEVENIVKFNKAVALHYFNTKPYIAAKEPLYCSELKSIKILHCRHL